jgi:hypothetical protein
MLSAPAARHDMARALEKGQRVTQLTSSEYYRERAARERSLAAAAEDAKIAAIHDELASRYTMLANEGMPDQMPTMRAG